MPASKTFRRAALAALLLAPAARAEAQRPCAAGSLERYPAEGFRCRIGGWVLSDFSSSFSATARGGAQALSADAASVTVSPFVSADAPGPRTFGFDVDGLASAAGSHGTTSGTEHAFGVSSFGFWLSSVTAGGELGAVRVAGAFGGANATPGVLRVGSTYGGSALAFTGSTADRFAGTAAADGFSAGSLTRVSFTEGAASAVPEPATVALSGAGLAGLGAFARRRARA